MEARYLEPPRKKRKHLTKQFEVVAPQASLDGMPDNVMLLIMRQLSYSVQSLIMLSRVCRRFHVLYRDESVWSDIELTKESLGSRLDSRKLKRIINHYLPRTLWRVKLSSNAPSYSAKNPIVTPSVVNDLFTCCPGIRSIILEKCDLSLFPTDSKLYNCETLKCLTLHRCETKLRWLENIQPSWPKLAYLSLKKTVMTTDADLKYIADHKEWTSTLRTLILCGCYRITNNGIQALRENLSNLKLLDVSECGTGVTVPGIGDTINP